MKEKLVKMSETSTTCLMVTGRAGFPQVGTIGILTMTK